MITSVLSRLFPAPEQPLLYVGYLNGARFATQWTVYDGPVSDVGHGGVLHQFRFFLELDPAVMGQGGSVIQQRARLLCDDALAPVRYHSHALGASVGLRFDGDQVHVDMPDGSRHTVPAGGAQFLIEANMSGQQALMLALAHERGLLSGEAQFTCFVVNGLLPTPYRTMPAPDLQAGEGLWLRSSHEEELRLGPDGVLQLARTPAQAIEVRREAPLPLPEWHAQEVLTVDRPAYAPPAGARFRLEEVEIPGPVTPLGGTLTIPEGSGPFPAVLFLSGSGTHDRHGISGEMDIGTHEIVDHLAGRGYLGLRYDTRGAGRTLIGADALEHGLLAKIEDARAALRYLLGRPEVDPRRLFLIGHSEGGSVALVLAREDPVPAGVALLATIGRGIDELLADQTVQHCRWLGLSAEQTAAQVQRLRDYVDLVMSERPWVAGEIPDHLFAGARSRLWMLEHMRHQPAELVREVRAPLLICQGEKDFQVSPERDAARLLQAAQAAGRDVTCLLLPGLDHLFKPVVGEESRIEQYFDRSRHVDAGFLDRLVEWLDAHLPGNG